MTRELERECDYEADCCSGSLICEEFGYVKCCQCYAEEYSSTSDAPHQNATSSPIRSAHRNSISHIWYPPLFQIDTRFADQGAYGTSICNRCRRPTSPIPEQLNFNPLSLNNFDLEFQLDLNLNLNLNWGAQQFSHHGNILQEDFATSTSNVIVEWDKANLLVGNLDHYGGGHPILASHEGQDNEEDHLATRNLYQCKRGDCTRRQCFVRRRNFINYKQNLLLNKITCKWPKCTKVMSILEIHTHQELCDYRTTTCKFSGCGREVLTKELDEHENMYCPKRPHACRWCFKTIVYEKIKKHQDVLCPERKTRCRWCPDLILVGKLEAHENKICSLRQVECIWCKEPYPISKIDRHKDRECPKRQTQCRWCSRMILHLDSKKHQESECRLRKIPCTWCSALIPFEGIKVHQNESCTKRKVRCMWCSNLFLLKDIEKHMDQICSMRRISCEWCSFLYPHSELQDHEDQCPDRKRSCKWCTALVHLSDAENHERWCFYKDARLYGCAICSRFESERPELVAHLQEDHVCDLVYGEICEGSQTRGSQSEGWYMFSFGVTFLCRIWFRGDGSVVFNGWYVGRDEEAHRYRILLEFNKTQTSLIKQTYCKPYNMTGGDIVVSADETCYFVDINVLHYTCRISKVVCLCDLCKEERVN